MLKWKILRPRTERATLARNGGNIFGRTYGNDALRLVGTDANGIIGIGTLGLTSADEAGDTEGFDGKKRGPDAVSVRDRRPGQVP